MYAPCATTRKATSNYAPKTINGDCFQDVEKQYQTLTT